MPNACNREIGRAATSGLRERLQFLRGQVKADRRCVAIGRGQPRERIRPEDMDAANVGEVDQAKMLKARERAAHRFDCQSEVIGNVLALHRQIDQTCATANRTNRKRGQKPREPLFRRTAPYNHRVIGGEGQRTRRPVEKSRADLRVELHPKSAQAARQNRHRRVSLRLDRHLVGPVRFEAAEVARHVKGEHLAASVSCELLGAEKPVHDEEEILRRIAFPDDLLPWQV